MVSSEFCDGFICVIGMPGLRSSCPLLPSSNFFFSRSVDALTAMALAWRREAAHDHSRVLAQCFAGADHGAGAEGLTAEWEEKIWQEASSWKGYCETLTITAALLGHEGCLRVLHELGGDVAVSLAAEVVGKGCGEGWTPAHFAARQGHEGCLRVLHELGGEAAASLAATGANGVTPAHVAAVKGHEGCLRVLHELGGDAAASLAATGANGVTPAHVCAV